MDKRETLLHYFGHHAFRPGQEDVIDHILRGEDVLAVMPTGAGKSLCYQVPALMLPGVTLVISPLISLMKDQVESLLSGGIRAAYINSSLTPRQVNLAFRRAMEGAYKLIYVAPERLHTYQMQLLVSRVPISLVAVDEAHCVSQWGHEFRPEYRQILSFAASLPERVPLCALTATATPQVREDIVSLLGLKKPFVQITSFDRPNLFFEVIPVQAQMPALVYLCKAMEGQSGIVYCMSRRNVEEVCSLLVSKGFSATRYHAGLEDAEKAENQEDFQFDRKKIMVATNAFGMGIDKSNVRFVIHFNLPLSMESYYQEAGRAGRDGLPSRAILLFSESDLDLGDFLLERTNPDSSLTPEEQERVRELARERFEGMVRYARDRRCLRRHILRYFGEKAPVSCSRCASCAGSDFPRLNPLSRGRSRRPPDRGGPERPRAPMPAALPRVPAPPAAAPVWQVPAGTLCERLLAVRAVLADHLSLPPYIIATDAALEAVAEAKPMNLAALAEVEGIGYARARSYGAAFLKAVYAYMDEHPDEKGDSEEAFTDGELSSLAAMLDAGRSPEEAAFRLGHTPGATEAAAKALTEERREEQKNAPAVTPPWRRLRPPRERSRARDWTSREERYLRFLLDKGYELHRLASLLGRSEGEVAGKLEELGLSGDDLL